jgi:hypothetical protein
MAPAAEATNSADPIYAQPVAVDGPEECVFYHALDLPSFGTVDGHWDLRGRFDEYVGYAKLRNRTVLDIGTASGFLSFEAERRGARVVSVDADSAARWHRLPFRQGLRQRDEAAWLSMADGYLTGIKKSYWLARRELGSSSRVYYGDASSLPAELGLFDVVLVGQILVHLRDVVLALTSAAARCKDTLIIAEGMIEDERPYSEFLGRADNPDYDYGFWHHSTGLYRELMAILGFRLSGKHAARYRCNLLDGSTGIEITTLIFERTQA